MYVVLFKDKINLCYFNKFDLESYREILYKNIVFLESLIRAGVVHSSRNDVYQSTFTRSYKGCNIRITRGHNA